MYHQVMADHRDDAPPQCAHCGYDLQGLRPQGRCPECGQSFDVTTGRGIREVSPLSRRNEAGDAAVFWFKFGSLAGLAVVTLGIGAILALGSPMPARPLSIAGLIAGMFAFGAAVTWVTDR